MSTINASDMSAIQQLQIRNQIETSVARKTLDVAEQQGDAVVSMLQASAQLQNELQSVDAHKGQLIDTRA